MSDLKVHFSWVQVFCWGEEVEDEEIFGEEMETLELRIFFYFFKKKLAQAKEGALQITCKNHLNCLCSVLG